MLGALRESGSSSATGRPAFLLTSRRPFFCSRRRARDHHSSGIASLLAPAHTRPDARARAHFVERPSYTTVSGIAVRVTASGSRFSIT